MNAGESSYGVDFTSLTSSMPNGQMLGEDQYKSGETSEINVVDGGSVSSWIGGGGASAIFREIIKIKGESCSTGKFCC